MKSWFIKIAIIVIFHTLISVFPTTIFAQTSAPGDANGDGFVDGRDYVAWLSYYNKTIPQPLAQYGDFDYNMIVDGRDYVVWLTNYGKINPTPIPTQSVTPTPNTKPAAAFFRIGPGATDVVPHQIIRTNTNSVYLFTLRVPRGSVIQALWANGFPSTQADFPSSQSTQITTPSMPLSVDSTYDGKNTIIVTTNLLNGTVFAYPFDIQTNTFKSPITLASDGNTQYSDIGTSGVSAVFDTGATQLYHLAYWTSANKIVYKTFSLSNFVLTQTGQTFQINSTESPSSNHPITAISPQDGSLTVAWVNGTDGAGSIYSRTKSTSGSWGQILKVNTSDVWTSPNAGLNIDQGPSLIITQDGVKHLVYIENWRVATPYDYGRIHYCTSTGGTWTDTYVNAYTHDPALSVRASDNTLYIFGHGYPLNTSSDTDCTNENNLCVMTKLSGSTSWGPQKILSKAITSGGVTYGFDASTSVKWSAAGWNRPDVVEFTIFSTNNNSYSDTSVWYGRL